MNKKLPGGNPAHLQYVQEARRSNETGFHSPTKKEKNKKNRKKNKQALKKTPEY